MVYISKLNFVYNSESFSNLYIQLKNIFASINFQLSIHSKIKEEAPISYVFIKIKMKS